MMAKKLSPNTFIYVKEYKSVNFFARNYKGDLHGYIWVRFSHNTLSETKIRNLHPKRDDEHPSLFYMGVPPPPSGKEPAPDQIIARHSTS